MKRNRLSIELRQYLREYHPHLVKDQDFIENRVEQAYQYILSCRNADMESEECIRITNDILYADLHFSVYQLITDIIKEESIRLEFEPPSKFALQMLEVMEPILSHYHIDDNFERTSAYDSLYNELSESIEQYIKLLHSGKGNEC